jgi:molybdenum cofactor cytidylyltransferase
MKFGPVPVAEAEGAVAAHSVRMAEAVLRKGATVTAADIARLRAAGIAEIVVARLESGDLDENEAASRLATALAGPGLHIEGAATGRVNIFAEASGVLRIDERAVTQFNAADEAITLATLPAFRSVSAGELVATVKIIPYGVPGVAVAAALSALAGAPPLALAAFRPKRVGVISTLLPGLKPGVVDKTLAVTRARLSPAGAVLVADVRIPHEPAALAAALKERAAAGDDIIVVFGASAITDRRDVIPFALVAAGCAIEHLGMPVDPGNLLMLGGLKGRPVLGAPGCARSPKENGFDWVLQRLLADMQVTRADIQAMGVGGLLMEIVSRPQPRAPAGTKAAPVAAIVLEIGRAHV